MDERNTPISLPNHTLPLNSIKSTKVIYILGASILLVVALFITLFLNQNKEQSKMLTTATQPSQTPFAESNDPLRPSKPYYGVNVDMSQLVPGASNYILNQKGEDYIDIANKLGIDLFRITNIFRGFENGDMYATYTYEQWKTVLDKMQRNGIKAVILIEAMSRDENLFSQQINDSYLNLVNKYILESNVGQFQNVIGIDLKNEPELSENNLTYIKKAKELIKLKYPNMPVCVGGWKVPNGKKDENDKPEFRYHDPSDIKELNKVVDFHCVHLYGFDKRDKYGSYPDPVKRTEQYIKKLSTFSEKKPILIEEFGAANGTTITDQQSIGSSILQARSYDGVYRGILNLTDFNVMGSSAYLFAQRGKAPDSWTIMSKDGNNLYPAAYVLQKYATGNSDINVDLTPENMPTPHIFKNDKNRQSVIVKVNDPVGFILKLTSSKKYIAIATPSNLTAMTQPITYDKTRERHNVVLQTKKAGTVNFVVYDDPSCSVSKPECGEHVVYSVTIKIEE